MYFCYKCLELNFRTTNELSGHLKRLHFGETNFTCFQGQCRRKFCESKLLIQHLKLIHKNDNDICAGNSIISEEVVNENPLFQENEKKKNKTKPNVPFNFLHKVLDDLSCQPDVRNIGNKDLKCISNESLAEEVLNDTLLFSANMFSQPGATRKVANNSREHSFDFARKIIDKVEKKINEINNMTDDQRQDFDVFLSALRKSLKKARSEKACFSELRKKGVLIDPVQYVIGRHKIRIRRRFRKPFVTTKLITGSYILLDQVFKKFLEIPGVFKELVRNIYESANDTNRFVISSFLQSKLWGKKKEKFKDKIVIPLFLYADDFETGNPLGSSKGKHKLTGVYASIPAFPDEYKSQLENIFLACLFPARFRKQFGNKAVYRPVLNQLKKLETEGVKISINNHDYQVYFVVPLIVGDNLGLNQMLGFTESFKANYYCRFCFKPKSECQVSEIEEADKLRNENNYQTGVYGIKENCIFNVLDNFNVLKNFAVDYMHDILEGVGRYVSARIIKELILSGIITLKFLNDRIDETDFGNYNRPPHITVQHLKKGIVKMSASEMSSFILFFSVLVGDKVPEENESWSLYLLLREILLMVSARTITENTHLDLKEKIQEFNFLFKDIFNEHLKPKFHILTHYPTCMQEIGPLANSAVFRFESEHQPFKQYAHIMNSRINLSFTCALKKQLMFAERLITNKGLDFNFEKRKEVFPDILRSLNIHNFKITENTEVVKYLKIKGQVFEADYTVIIFDFKDDLPEFGKIKLILIPENSLENPIFIYSKLELVEYNSHLAAFEIQELGNDSSYFVTKFTDLYTNIKPSWITQLNDKKFIVREFMY